MKTMLQNCPVCHQNYDQSPACIIPCKEGHIMCFNCLNSLWQDDSVVKYEDCWLLGKNCREIRRHKNCPICQSAFHIRDNDLENILRLPINDVDIENLLIFRRITRENIFISAAKLKVMGSQKIEELNGLIKELNDVTKKGRMTKIGSSSVGIVGGIMMLTGAILAIPSMGASTPLMVAGGVMAGGAATTNLGTNITEHFKNKKLTQEAYDSWKELQNEFEEFLYLNHEFSIQSAALIVSYHNVISSVKVGNSLVGSVVGVMTLATQLVNHTSTSAVQSIGSLVGKSVGIISLISMSLSVIVDTVALVWNSMQLYKKTPSEFVANIQQIIDTIRGHVIREAENAEKRLEMADDSFIDDLLKLHKDMKGDKDNTTDDIKS